MDRIKLKRTSVTQTGIAILVDKEGNTKQIPLYSNNPCDEARELRELDGLNNYTVKDVFYTNNMMEYKIEKVIENFVRINHFLPESIVDEMVMGFPGIIGFNNNYCYCYK